MNDNFLGYYYFGFHSALVRYRLLTVEGWIVTAIGAGGLFFTWGRPADLLPIVVALSAVVAGVSIVQQSVASLDQYVRIPFPDPGSSPPEIAAGIVECARLMEEIDRGGWQEAVAALRALDGMKERFSFPPLP